MRLVNEKSIFRPKFLKYYQKICLNEFEFLLTGLQHVVSDLSNVHCLKVFELCTAPLLNERRFYVLLVKAIRKYYLTWILCKNSIKFPIQFKKQLQCFQFSKRVTFTYLSAIKDSFLRELMEFDSPQNLKGLQLS